MRNWSRSIGISGTLIIHLSLLLQFIVIPSIKKPPPPPPLGNQQEVVITLLPPAEHKSVFLPANGEVKTIVQTDPSICEHRDNNYLGVGFRYSPFTNLVLSAPTYYPAYKAGVRVGDMLLDPDSPIVNNYLDIEIVRGFQQMHFHIKAEQICFKSGLTKPEQ